MTDQQNANPDQRKGPFDGLLVIDLTHVLNGPFGTTYLADMGARVIKVETPGHGDDTRMEPPFVDDKSLYFNFVNRGKESIVLNLKGDDDLVIFRNMLKQADILTENFRPGVMERLGFPFNVLQEINPRLIYASSSGFGHTGPLSDYPAYDTIIQAMSGLMAATGFPHSPPTKVGTTIADLLGGIHLFAGVATALYDREITGKGARVDIAMFDATLACMAQPFMDWSATGNAPERIGNRHMYAAPFDVFAAADKHFVICCGNDHLFGELCRAIGAPELIEDERFTTDAARIAHVDALKTEIEKHLSRHQAHYWLDVLHEAGVPVGPILNIVEAVNLPQTAVRNMVIEAGGIKMPGNPVKLAGYPDPETRTAAPELNQHGEQLRQEFTSKE